MERIAEKKKCNGCEACCTVCPKNAIEMHRDKNGFFYPQINEALCIKCGICGKVCPVLNKVGYREIDYNDTLAYGGYDLNIETLNQSSSGGFFGTIAQSVLSEGGVVYGVIFSNDYREVYFTSSDDIAIDRMRGSKYVTARKNKIYNNVRKQLGIGRNVLFVGLPCEVAALYAILGKDYENLLTCELICAGASSYNLLDTQLEWLEGKYKQETIKFSFRFKKYGWVPYSILWEAENGIKYTKIFDKTIFGVGMKYAKREACFECIFKNLNRTADFTIGDFWNIDKKMPYYNENGTSVVFVRTKKAEQFMGQITQFKYFKVDPDDAVKSNYQQLKRQMGMPNEREKYLEDLLEKGGEAAFNKYKPKRSMKSIIKNNMPVGLYKFLRRIEVKLR